MADACDATSKYVPASGLTYTRDDVDAFCKYIYAEYWADDLRNDRFVPEACILAHFTSDIKWTYGGATPNPAVPLIGSYTGHDGMSSFLGGFGDLVQVKVWEARTLVVTGGPQEYVCFVDLNAEYVIRSTGTEVALDEVHMLRLRRRASDGEPQISEVRIVFDQKLLEQATSTTTVEQSATTPEHAVTRESAITTLEQATPLKDAIILENAMLEDAIALEIDIMLGDAARLRAGYPPAASSSRPEEDVAALEPSASTSTLEAAIATRGGDSDDESTTIDDEQEAEEEEEEEGDDLLAFCVSQPVPQPRGPSDDELTVPRVPYRDVASGAIAFAEVIRRRRPVILTGAVEDWPALTRWSDHSYLRRVVGSTPVHVALTPDGLADAVTRTHPSGLPHFAKACEVRMPFETFLDAIEQPLSPTAARPSASDDPPLSDAPMPSRRAIHYCSHQDDSLTAEFASLWADCATSLSWADAAYGCMPAAANFWCGEDAARTSVHADLFDNLYAVTSGEKRFSLLPPQDGPALRRRPFRAGTYVPVPGAARDESHASASNNAAAVPAAAVASADRLTLKLDKPPSVIHWATVDLESPDHDEAAQHDLRVVRACVRPGELLYLPALWWHAVSQRRGHDPSTTAVNYWYDRSCSVAVGGSG